MDLMIYNNAGTDADVGDYTRYDYSNPDFDACVWNGQTLRAIFNANNVRTGYTFDNAVYCAIWFSGPMTVDTCNLWQHVTGTTVDGETGTYCGDGTCNGAEDCSTCASDCGSCATYTAVLELSPSLVQLNDKVTGEAYLLKDGTDKVLPDNAGSVYIGTNGKNILKLEFDDNNVAEFDFIPSQYPAIFATNQSYSVSVQFTEGADTATGTSSLSIGDVNRDNGDYTGEGIGVVDQDGITWIFKFTKDKYTAADFVPNYGAKAGYTVTAVPSSGVKVPPFQTYIDVNLGSEKLLENRFFNCAASSSGTNGFTEPLYLGTLFTNKDLSGHCLLTYTMNGQSKSLNLYATSKFVSSGGAGGSGTSSSDKSLFGRAWDGIKGVASDVWSGTYGAAKELASDAKDGAEDLAKDVYKGITSVASDVWKGVTSTTSRVAESVIKTVTGGASSGGSLLSGVTKFLSGAMWGVPVILIIGIVAMVFLFRRGD
jgi:hypothetical protein